MPKTCYDILGLSPQATDGEVKRAYRALALRWHPDRHPGSGRAAALRRFQAISEAYAQLRTGERRAAYDRRLRAQNDNRRRETWLSEIVDLFRRGEARP